MTSWVHVTVAKDKVWQRECKRCYDAGLKATRRRTAEDNTSQESYKYSSGDDTMTVTSDKEVCQIA